MSKASKMIQAMDQLQITQKPYKAHYLTECDQKIRQQYLQLLFSVVSLEGFNDAQQRIWQLLSQSIGVDGTSSDEMNSELIQNVVQSCVANKLHHVFVLDLLVLLRLNTVSDEQARILAELISLFALSNEDVDALIHLSDLILSISDKGQNLTEFKYETIRHWHEFSYQILTKELLVAGLNGGRWIQLNDITEVNKPVNINSSSLYCMGEKLISTANHPIKIKDSQFDVNLKAENCTLEILETNFANKSIELLGDRNNTFFEDCNFARFFEASYDDPIYLNCPKGTLKINKCNFQMENIATINFVGSQITIENSAFEECGNPKGNGVMHCECRHNPSIVIKNSKFINCRAKNKAAAVLIHSYFDSNSSMYNSWLIENCQFINCLCVDIDRQNWEDLARCGSAVYIYYRDSNHIRNIKNAMINHCHFENSSVFLDVSLYLSYRWYSMTDLIFADSTLINSPIYAGPYYTNKQIDRCTFENGNKTNIIETPKEV